MLMVQMKAPRAEICQQLLSQYKNEDEEFLRNIMTADKMWVHHYEHESKHQSITKLHPQNRKFKTQAWEGKVKATVLEGWWFIHTDYLEDGTTINKSGILQHSKL